MPFLHLPVQSGSDRVLAAMNRRHRADDYCRTVAKLRAARADLALSSDFIVGFPGESDADFEATLALVRETGFAQAFSFKYSRRAGPRAVFEREGLGEADRRGRAQRRLEIGVALAGKADDEVGRQGEVGTRPRAAGRRCGR